MRLMWGFLSGTSGNRKMTRCMRKFWKLRGSLLNIVQGRKIRRSEVRDGSVLFDIKKHKLESYLVIDGIT
jgi:hypothetical protein